MREIKFRAWDKNRGKNGIMLENHTFESISATGLASYDDLIWMQFTGLKDKNGVEIYEGDILKIDGDIIAPVTFEDGSFQIISLREQGRSPLIQERAKRMVIAGNIYENPDLINQTNGRILLSR